MRRIIGLASVCGAGVALAMGCRGGAADRTDAPFLGRASFTRAEYAAAPRLALRRLYAICEGGRTPECQFRLIDLAALGPGRRVLLVQAGAVAQEFDSAGRWSGPLGRLSAGPGEYRNAMALGFDSAGGVAVFDLAAFRIVRFDHLRRAAWTASVRYSVEFAGVSAKGGRVVQWLVPGSEPRGGIVMSQFALLDSTGGSEAFASVATKALRVPGSDMVPIQPFFAVWAVWDVDPVLSIVYAPGDRMQIERYRGDGVAELLIEGDVPLRPVTSAEVEASLDRNFLRRVPTAAAQLREAARNAAGFHPAITGLAVLVDGSIWAKGSPASESDPTRYDVFSRDGRLTGYVMLPAAARVIDGDQSVVLVAAVDGAGAPFAAVYRR